MATDFDAYRRGARAGTTRTDDLSAMGDLHGLPQHFTEMIGPAGEAAMDRALEDGLSPMAALLVADAAHSAAWRQSPSEFRARMLSLRDQSIFFDVARELMERAGLWPWPEDAA